VIGFKILNNIPTNAAATSRILFQLRFDFQVLDPSPVKSHYPGDKQGRHFEFHKKASDDAYVSAGSLNVLKVPLKSSTFNNFLLFPSLQPHQHASTLLRLEEFMDHSTLG
jgi:hypothetical protein